jgi:hypothetical protein
VVSDWSDVNSHVLLSSLNESRHPFTEVVVMLPDGVQPPKAPVASVSTQFINRAKISDQADLCTAQIDTVWFMMTDSYHQPRQDLQLMTQYDKGHYKPVVSFAKANQETCFADQSCAKEFRLAKEILPSIKDVYQNHDFVFHTKTRNDYCNFLESHFPNGKQESATSYVAFLRRFGHAQRLYVDSDRNNFGSRRAFLPLAASSLPPLMLQQRGLIENNMNETNTNGTNTNRTNTIECTSQRIREDCLAASCEWRLRFSSCRDQLSTPSNVNSGERGTKERPYLYQTGFGAIALISLLVVGVGRMRSSNSSASWVPSSGEGKYQPFEGDDDNSGDASGEEDDEISLESVDLECFQFLEDVEEHGSDVEFA